MNRLPTQNCSNKDSEIHPTQVAKQVHQLLNAIAEQLSKDDIQRNPSYFTSYIPKNEIGPTDIE
jgi:hypothetical protein